MSELENLAHLDDVETGVGDDGYEPPSQFPAPPEAGTYTFMRIEEDPEMDFKKGRFETENGSGAWYNFRVQIQGGPHDGRTTFAGCNTLVSQYRKGSSADDFLRASRSGLRPRTFKEWDEAVPKVFGPFQAVTNWEWRCKDCEETFLKGMKTPKAPRKYKGPKATAVKLANGTTSHVVKCPLCGQEVGANLVITQFVVPRAGEATVKSNGNHPAAPIANVPPAAG